MKKEVEYMIMKAPGVSRFTNLEEFTELTFAQSPIDLETTKYYFSFDAHNDTAPANKLKVKDEAMYNQIIGSLSFKLRIFLDSDHLDTWIHTKYIQGYTVFDNSKNDFDP